jgi:hypothetical protein
MHFASRFFRKIFLVRALQQVSLMGVMACCLPWVSPALAQSQWRSVSGAAPGPEAEAAAFPALPDQNAPASAQAAEEGGLHMFGVRLSAATRDAMRQAARQANLKVQREDNALHQDIYDAPNLMPGLLQLKFSYAPQSQRLTRVDYVFMTFSDNAHVEDVKLRIQGRFGQPNRVTGHEERGPFQAVWRLPDEMEIVVGREWPQRTTYLRFINTQIVQQVPARAEHEALRLQREKIQNSQALPTWVKP